MEASPPPPSEGGTDAPLAVPERPPPMQDQLASEPTSSVPLNKGSTSNNEGDSMAPDRLFGASEKSSRPEPPKAPDLSEQRKRMEQASTPLSQASSPASR